MSRLSLASLLLFAAPLAAQSATPPRPANLVGQTYFLRSLCEGDNLRFTSDGQPAEPCPHESFTVALLTIDKAEPGASELKLTAHRVGLSFHDNVAHELDLSHPRRGRKPHDVTLHLAAPPSGDFAAPVAAVLTNNYADLLPSLPEYWQGYAQAYLLQPAAAPTSAATDIRPVTQQEIDTAQINPASAQNNDSGSRFDKVPYPWGKELPHKLKEKGIIAPTVLTHRDASFSREARSMLAYGASVIRLVVDEQGMPQHLAVVSPAGLGLDEQAMAAIAQYRFAPATRDGKPVSVVMNIESSFQIF